MLSKLTTRELQVLRLITIGYSNSQIGKILNITLHTVKAHVQAILYKFKVKNRVQAAVIAARYMGFDEENFNENISASENAQE